MAQSSSPGLPDRPISVEQIVKYAEEPFFDAWYSMQNWFRTARLMLKQASIYEHEGDDQTAYFLLYRHARLVLNDLPKHPQAQDPQFKQSWNDARSAVKRNLAKMEQLKPNINKRFERYEKQRKIRAQQASAAKAQEPKRHAADHVANGMSRPSQDSERQRRSSLGESRDGFLRDRLDPLEHRDAAVQLANREIQRRTQRSVRREPHPSQPTVLNDGQETRSRMEEARRQIERSSTPRRSMGEEQKHQPPHPNSYQYPHVPDKTQSQSYDHTHISPPLTTPNSLLPGRPPVPPKAPQLPPKESLPHEPPSKPGTSTTIPPPIPSKQPVSPTLTPPASRPTSPQPTHQFSTLSHLESGAPLRTIFLPTPLRHRFLAVAAANTRANLETCGILCGTLIQNAFFITKLVIPEQTSTSDTCEMVNEAALHTYCDAQPEELMVLGWIHTHPSQTCFMSSRDCHTHCWYQVSLPESIAIVCAPSKDPDWGVFRLTDPPGLQAIRNCRQPGLFHPHDEAHIFTDALGRPGHVVEHQDLRFEVVDLRP